MGPRRCRWEPGPILATDGFSGGAQSKAKARPNTHNQATVTWLGKGGHGKAPLGHPGVTSAHQECREVEGRMGAPRVTEALGTGRPLARERMGDPRVKDTHPFKVPHPSAPQRALSPKKELCQPWGCCKGQKSPLQREITRLWGSQAGG